MWSFSGSSFLFLQEHPQNDRISPSLLWRNNVLFWSAFDHQRFTLKAVLLGKCIKQSCNQKNDYVQMTSSDFLSLFHRHFFVFFVFWSLLLNSFALWEPTRLGELGWFLILWPFSSIFSLSSVEKPGKCLPVEFAKETFDLKMPSR